MIPLANAEVRSYRDLESLRKFVAGRDRRDIEVPGSELHLNEDGILRAGSCQGRMTATALKGLLGTFQIPETYAVEVCPSDLLVDTVGRLARGRETPVRIHAVDEVITAVFPSNRTPIRHDVLLSWLDPGMDIHEATFGPDYIRITALSKGTGELLPGDTFGYGWELRNSESGWLPMEVRRYVMRLVCTNGMVGFERTCSFSRKPTGQSPILASLEKLSQVLSGGIRPPKLDSAVKWAAGHHLGEESDLVTTYLARTLEGDATALALAEVRDCK